MPGAIIAMANESLKKKITASKNYLLCLTIPRTTTPLGKADSDHTCFSYGEEESILIEIKRVYLVIHIFFHFVIYIIVIALEIAKRLTFSVDEEYVRVNSATWGGTGSEYECDKPKRGQIQ
uniref:Uncharacterized protein n=1 Tax=Romanomermis culicivorax TaxID=13658 RepID=A0A915HNW1_ROMCU